MYYVYIIECKDGKLYTGITDDVERRFKEHHRRACPERSTELGEVPSRRGSHFTSYNHAVGLLYKETFPNKSQAARREKQIKGWTKKVGFNKRQFRSIKEALIFSIMQSLVVLNIDRVNSWR
ncbi:MAG: GIY-YIG nuclease family protein [Candidatus Omnitrophica bacterium]|nr:GIY-YIG nuclease family protein [Candidatus Omnitrophota bacterium]